MYTRQVEILKRRLEQKGYPDGLKTRKGGPGKRQGIKSYDYFPLDHLTDKLENSEVLINSINFRQGSKWTRCSETQRLQQNGNPLGLFHIAIFSLYQIFIFYDGIILLECLSHCTKNTYSKSIQRYPFENEKLSVFLYSCVLFTKTSSDLLLNICI